MRSEIRSVLIVDDDADIRAYLADLVINLGARPLQASDGAAAVEAVRGVLPDLILMDVEMPNMDGLTACRTLKSNPDTQRIPIIMITSLGALNDRVSGIEAGADDFLTKPVQVPEFNARVKSLLRIKKLNDSLESAENVIFTLANAIEAKDRYTQGHTQRVTAYALELGKATGSSESELLSLRHGGSLHDIGKIAVPDAILNKPGKLTPEEFQLMSQHTVVGFNICAPMKSLAHALPCIRSHHEKPNGTGYPDGLKGVEIPRVALIIAVADVFDALTSKRAYKEAIGHDRAHGILAEEAYRGALDAELVKCFTRTVMPGFHAAAGSG